MKRYSVTPAAGLSRRMGRPKLQLRLGKRTVLEHVLAALNASRVDHVLVVLGPSARFLAELVEPPAEILMLDADTPDMRATVCAGLRHLEERFHPADDDALLLALGDQPTIRAALIDRLVAEHGRDTTKIRVPSIDGRRGHPTLFPWSLTKEFAELPADQGIDALVRSRPERVAELPTDESAILEDLDTPVDYERLRRRDWEG